MSEHDEINHPRHYTSHPSGVECIQITEHMGFCIGNAIKYLWRADEKHSDPLPDLHKAKWYVEREIARRENAATASASASLSNDQAVLLALLHSHPTGAHRRELRDALRWHQNRLDDTLTALRKSGDVATTPETLDTGVVVHRYRVAS